MRMAEEALAGEAGNGSHVLVHAGSIWHRHPVKCEAAIMRTWYKKAKLLTNGDRAIPWTPTPTAPSTTPGVANACE